MRKPVVGYEGLYEVDELGNIYSLDRVFRVNERRRNYDVHKKGRMLKATKRCRSYMCVGLTKDGKTTTHSVHRIVAQAFIPNPNNLPFVNHKDENPSNNSIENLEWCTAKYNNTYGTKIQRWKEKTIGTHRSKATKDKLRKANIQAFHEKQKRHIEEINSLLLLHNRGKIKTFADMSVFREKVLGILKTRQMTQRDLARKIGVSDQDISKYLHGRLTLNPSIVVAVINALDVSCDYVMGFQDR